MAFLGKKTSKDCNHDKKTELMVGFYKVKSGLQSVTYQEALDEALCFGWIDSVRKSINDESYFNRFTPRNPKSNWSAVNINKIEELTKKGLMHPAGIAAFENVKKAGQKSTAMKKKL